MFTLKGKYGEAEVMTDNIDEVTINQIMNFLNEEFTDGVKIAIMPDTHAGKNAVIGTTMQIKDQIVPNLVGSDIGCGVICIEVKIKDELDLNVLDETIRKYIPLGPTIHDKPQTKNKKVKLHELKCLTSRDDSMLWHSFATLGGGNHFIELGKFEDRYFLTIHTGSRSIGTIVCRYHQKNAFSLKKKELNVLAIEKIKQTIDKKHWQTEIEALKGKTLYVDKELASLKGKAMDDYLHDLNIAQQFAFENRKQIGKTIVEKMNWEIVDMFDSVHNYIDIEHMILRKGAISAREGERIIIPINMRDGSLVGIGKGNDDWNQSAPHGAGRLLSRSQAKSSLDVESFKDDMKDVFSTCVGFNTIDESPKVYKPIDEIIEKTKPTMDLEFIIKPIFNIKG